MTIILVMHKHLKYFQYQKILPINQRYIILYHNFHRLKFFYFILNYHESLWNLKIFIWKTRKYICCLHLFVNVLIKEVVSGQ